MRARSSVYVTREREREREMHETLHKLLIDLFTCFNFFFFSRARKMSSAQKIFETRCMTYALGLLTYLGSSELSCKRLFPERRNTRDAVKDKKI